MKFLTIATLSLLASTSIASATEGLALSQNADTIQEENAYNYEFNRDEQCQGYALGVARLGIENPCVKEEEEKVVKKSTVNVLSEYTVYFDFDESEIRANDKAVLNDAARDITKYNPSEVRIAGHTDTRGSMAYNEVLSASRADNVSDYLTSLGVSNFVVDEDALGETNLAVPTGDEVKEQKNRRVTIQFIR